MESKNQKHKNQFLSKQTLGPFGWVMKKMRGDPPKLILTKKRNIGWGVKK